MPGNKYTDSKRKNYQKTKAKLPFVIILAYI